MKSEPTEAQTSLRMPGQLHDKLAKAAAAAGRSMGEEIRRRLETSFGAANADPKTAELLRVIAVAAEFVGRQCAPWHADPYAHVVMRTIVAELFAKDQPKGEPVPPPGSGAIFDGPPEQLGRIYASLVDVL